jgi:hypothetical protein
MLGDVLPGEALDYHHDRSVVDAEHPGERLVPVSPSCVQPADLANLIRVQLGTIVIDSARSSNESPLLVHVPHVVRVCAEKEMAWPQTAPHVTFVEHKQAVSHGPVRNGPTQYMRSSNTAAVTDAPVSICGGRSRPQPARREPGSCNRPVLVDALPKALSSRSRAARLTQRGHGAGVRVSVAHLRSASRTGGLRSRPSHARAGSGAVVAGTPFKPAAPDFELGAATQTDTCYFRIAHGLTLLGPGPGRLRVAGPHCLGSQN